MRFQRGAVLGSGKLAAVCGEILAGRGLPVEIYDTGDRFSSFLALAARRAGIPYHGQKPREVFQELAGVREPLLIVSAINPQILPAGLLRNPNVLAVNCHQALLPAHPGRNAEMWAIYEGDSETGITWHAAGEQVDSGAILTQKRLPITAASTAYTIFQQQIRLAGEAFRELAPVLLEGGPELGRPALEEVSPRPKIHYSWELPNGGLLDPKWDGDQISRFLRATDYGILPVISPPEIRIGGETYHWKTYRITSEHRFPEGIHQGDRTLWLQKEGLLFELRLR